MLRVAAAKRRGDFALNVEFELATRGVVALFGRSGCGKSTVVNIIAGLLAADSGRIELDDTILLDTQQRINVLPESRGIGYVFQDARLFPHLSVAANLRYGLRRAKAVPYVTLERVSELLALGPLMNRRTHQLSGGERQRVAIGRALLAQPRLLLLDEPLAALDGARREEVLPYLETLRDQLAIPMVYVTHDFAEVLRLATHLVLMDAGQVVAQGALGDMSLHPQLRALIGPDEVGAIIDGAVMDIDTQHNLARVRVGGGVINVQATGLAVGTALRVQLLARDIIISTEMPRHLSVRNSIEGIVTHIQSDDADTDLITLDIGGNFLMARITRGATTELQLELGSKAWALVKSVSLRGHAFPAPASPASNQYRSTVAT
jgi:molybdate transport system ATP-binding protein